jgi:hypothetical protein
MYGSQPISHRKNSYESFKQGERVPILFDHQRNPFSLRRAFLFNRLQLP